MREILGFMDQSNISRKNVTRLKALGAIDDATFQKLRMLILEIAQVAPRRRRRGKLIASSNGDLLERAIEAGLIEDLLEPDQFEESEHDVLAEMRDPDDFDSYNPEDDFHSAANTERSEIELPESEIPF